MADALDLHNGELQLSWDALQRVGNLSSASVLVVLDEVMTHRRPAAWVPQHSGRHGAWLLFGDVVAGVVGLGERRLIRCDALIAGGGPAGLAAAIALRQKGLDVLVADALQSAHRQGCGEGLMPDARNDLAALGVSFRRG